MTRQHATILRLFSLWTVFVWGTRIRNIIGDDSTSTGFKAVHVALAVVSVLFAVACWWVVTQNRGRNLAKRMEAERLAGQREVADQISKRIN
jgi:hypothetical protein